MKPLYVPAENTQRKANIAREPGLSSKLIPESKDEKHSPEVSADEDPFAGWF